MSKLQDMLRVQARLHRKQGANALGDLFDNSSKEIESLSEKLAKANESALFYKEQYEKTDRECTKLAMRESKANERVKELEYYNVALANESHNKSLEIDKANERIEMLLPITDTLYGLARNQLWIAYVWNDHNFKETPEKYAREAAESLSILNAEEANKLFDAYQQLLKEQEK